MNNQMLIKNLAKDLAPWKSIDSLPVFFLKWLILSAVFFGINASWMPWRLDFHQVATDSAFMLENCLWLTLLLTSAFALYESAFPQNETKKFSVLSLITFIVLIILSFKNHQASFAEQWIPEMDLWRGRCGFIISFFAVLETPFLVMWAKRGAPKSAGMAGAYAALSSASLGCLLMQVICDHHNSLHLILWHFIPLALMSFAGFLIAKKVLRW
jgi:hypothetical protein